METVIDWSKAPEGFPLWLEGTNEEHRKHSGWYRDAGQVFEGAHGGQWRACREGQFFTIHRNPGPLTWTGEGLPPVGICEALFADGDCRQVDIVGFHDGYAVFFNKHRKDDEPLFAAWPANRFRPIRTPEQVEAEDRDAAIANLYFTINWNERRETWPIISSERKADYGRAIDAGYRQQVQP